jgi:hypothetical protein
MGYRWDGVVEYPDSFNLKDKGNDLELYLKASTAPNQTETYKKQLQKQIAQTVIMDESELSEIYNEIDEPMEQFEPHIMQNPNTGETRIANTEQEHLELASRGWFHP